MRAHVNGSPQTPPLGVFGPVGAMSRRFVAGSSQFGYLDPDSGVPGSAETMAIWFRDEGTFDGVRHLLISHHYAPTNPCLDYFRITLDGNGAVEASQSSSGSGTSGTSISTNKYVLNTWNHVAAVFASNVLRTVYLNGVPAVANTTSVVGTALRSKSIGAFIDNAGATVSLKATASLAEAAMWNTALSAADVLTLNTPFSLYGTIGFPPAFLVQQGLQVNYWPLFGLTSPEPDYRNRDTFGLTGAPVQSTSRPPILYPQGSIWIANP